MNFSPLHTTPSQSNMTTSILSSREGSQGVGWDQVSSKLGAGEEEEEGGGGEVGVKGTLMQMHGVEKDAEDGPDGLVTGWKALVMLFYIWCQPILRLQLAGTTYQFFAL